MHGHETENSMVNRGHNHGREEKRRKGMRRREGKGINALVGLDRVAFLRAMICIIATKS